MKTKKCLDGLFGGHGTRIEFESRTRVYNDHVKSPLMGSVDLQINLTGEGDTYNVILDMSFTDPEERDHQIVRLSAKKGFVESLITLLLEAKDSVEFSKVDHL